MKRNHGIFQGACRAGSTILHSGMAGFAVLLLAAIFTLAGCAPDGGGDDPNNNIDNPDNPDNPDGPGQNTSGWTVLSGTDSTFGRNTIYGVAYNGSNLWVAVGKNGKMAYSTDGATWMTVSDSTFGATTDILGIAYGGGKFVAVGRSGKMAYSENGTTWTAISSGTATGGSQFGSNQSITAITYGAGKFFAVSNMSGMAYSEDGITWTSVNLTGDRYISYMTGITYGNGKFVAFGNGDDAKIVYASDTACTTETGWTPVTINTFTSNTESIAYGGATGQEKFIAVGWSGTMASSTDGTAWAAVSNTTFDDEIRAVAHGGGKWVAGGGEYAGHIATSPDGTTWTAVSGIPFPSTDDGNSGIFGIVYGSGKFVAVGDYGTIAYSNAQ